MSETTDQVFWVRRKNRMVGGPFWVVEVRGDGGATAVVETHQTEADAAAACADLNGRVLDARKERALIAAKQAQRPRLSMQEARQAVEQELDAAGIAHERLGGGPLSFGFRPNR